MDISSQEIATDIVIQSVGGNNILAAAQLDIINKLSLTRFGMILTPIGNQLILTINILYCLSSYSLLC